MDDLQQMFSDPRWKEQISKCFFADSGRSQNLVPLLLLILKCNESDVNVEE